ncbi:MAG: RluA family pseudouridine synthase [Rickettsiales bacterium]|jgi:23S rRNA pseudouridine1911/1915/1917 synthase|nr:RluA family pseudouridine synthase [Rickettsiales bacterium]
MKLTYIVGQRLDKSITDETGLSRVTIQDIIRNGNVLKNGVIFTNNSYKIKENDIIDYEIPEFDTILKTKEMKLDIVYEDDDLIVINKPSGLIVHPNGHNDTDTLVNVLLSQYGDNLSTIGGEFRPGIVHRLDKDTSGLMIVAKNDESHLNLKLQLENRELSRNYIGIVWGVFTPKEGQISGYITRNVLKMKYSEKNNGGRYSLTNYKTINTYLEDSLSMVDFKLDTGRTHQIRLHCFAKGHSIVGDYMYGGHAKQLKNTFEAQKYVNDFPRQALHSYKITFKQPSSGEEKSFEVEMSDDMKELVKILENK